MAALEVSTDPQVHPGEQEQLRFEAMGSGRDSEQDRTTVLSLLVSINENMERVNVIHCLHAFGKYIV